MGSIFFLKPDSRHVPDAQILADLRRVASLDPPGSRLTARRYRLNSGRFSITLITCRFSTWNRALAKAGLHITHRYRIPDEEFFLQMEKVWRTLRRQPTRSAFAAQPTKISTHAYIRRFGSWHAALLSFTTWANSPSYSRARSLPSLPSSPKKLIPHPRAHPLKPSPTPRTPSIGLRHRILKRDNFKCVHCGRSPATHPNVILHIDHILPWSKGGPTLPKNLQTLCDQCNRGKATSLP